VYTGGGRFVGDAPPAEQDAPFCVPAQAGPFYLTAAANPGARAARRRDVPVDAVLAEDTRPVSRWEGIPLV